MVQGMQLGPVQRWPAARSGDKAIDPITISMTRLRLGPRC